MQGNADDRTNYLRNDLSDAEIAQAFPHTLAGNHLSHESHICCSADSERCAMQNTKQQKHWDIHRDCIPQKTDRKYYRRNDTDCFFVFDVAQRASNRTADHGCRRKNTGKSSRYAKCSAKINSIAGDQCLNHAVTERCEKTDENQQTIARRNEWVFHLSSVLIRFWSHMIFHTQSPSQLSRNV